MCGRYLITSAPEAFRRLFGYPEQPNFPARYNVAPTQPVPIVRLIDGKRQFTLVRWGLIPPWVKDPRKFTLLINARGESVNEKPAFRNAMRRRRCLIPADGYYEWQDSSGRKRPLFIHRRDGKPVGFAAVAETWMGPNGEEMETAAIVTKPADRDLTHLHDRMPVIVSPDAFDFWLDGSKVDATTAAALFDPGPGGLLEAYEISPAVNRVENDTADLIAPFSADAAAEPSARAPAKREKKKDERQGSLF
jgi:putative SOS response-associated peptidase YedK